MSISLPRLISLRTPSTPFRSIRTRSIRTRSIQAKGVRGLVAAGVVATVVGCGSSTETAENRSDPAIYPAEVAADPLGTAGPDLVMTEAAKHSAIDVVSEFLDAVRRGGSDSPAGDLLTQRAQSELARIGHELQPLGTPSARFEVTRAESIPSEPGSAFVQSYWIEPNPEGSETTLQVVWLVQWERGSWKISGLTVELSPENLMVLDFENGDQMAQHLASMAGEAGGKSETQDKTPQVADQGFALPQERR